MFSIIPTILVIFASAFSGLSKWFIPITLLIATFNYLLHKKLNLDGNSTITAIVLYLVFVIGGLSLL